MAATILAQSNPGTVVLNQAIPNTRDGGNHPHLVDIYIPVSYDEALVCLHGGTGTKENFARNLRITSGEVPSVANVRWTSVNRIGALLVVPQGQHCNLGNAGPWNPQGANTVSETYPNGVATWSNWNMWSGADDPQFLKDLSTWLAATYPAATKRALCGHSNGGMMAHRMWYEAQASYTHYCTLSGPAPHYLSTIPAPATGAPFFMQFGAKDTNLGILDGLAGPGPHFYEEQYAGSLETLSVADYNYPLMGRYVGALRQLQVQVTAIGGGTIDAGDGAVTATSGTPAGTRTDWIYWLGKVHLRLLSEAGHDLTSHQNQNGSILAMWALFTRLY